MIKQLARIIFLSWVVMFAAGQSAHAAINATATGTSFASTVAVSSFTLNRPSNVNVGDLLVVQISLNTNSITVTAPSGWTQLRVDTNNSVRQYVFYRVATAADTANGATSWTVSSSAFVAAGMVGFRSDITGRSIVLDTNAMDSGNSATLTGSSVTASSTGLLLRFFGYARGTTSFTSSGLGRLVDTTTTGTTTGTTILFASRTLASGGATGTDSVTSSNSARWLVQSLVLIESSPAKPSTCYSDNFSSTATFGQNWITTSVGTTAFTPAIVSGRLRLTDNNFYESTGATLQRLFPTSNLIYVEFNHYAYPSSSGADGIAVTLSDATITPQPGGFGGSLGYAQRTDSGGINGFAGGWMGIALDEYGNYSNPTEGRNGGTGSVPDAVAVRGSGSGLTGYAYVAGTSTLSPGIDTTTTPGPGYRYRIIIDAVAANQTYVTVDRDTTGAGTSYTNIIPTFNLQSASGQAAIPANLMLTFTGSTGGSKNIHEIGNLSVCATTINSTNLVDHFEFTYSSQALTCEPASITITACADAACSTTMSIPVTVTMNSSSGTSWASNPITFTGSTTLQLVDPTAGTATFSVASSSPGSKAFSTNKCNGTSSNTCSLPFANAGLEFNVPTLLANKPSGAVTLRAVKSSGAPSNSCVALFQNTTQSINFWSTYTTPNTGTRAMELRPGSGSGAFTSISGNSAAPTALNLTFDNNGQTTFEARYQDAGLMALNAIYNGSGAYAGLVLSGSDSFVSQPAGFCIDTPTSSTVCNGPAYANCSPFVAAGIPFKLQITAAAWESDTDANFCSGNGTTPNYNQIGIPLSNQLISPTGANANNGALTSYNNTFNPSGINMTNGSATLTDLTESEVGVFTFTAKPPTGAYFGQTVNGGTSRNIGRFVPYRFDVAVSAAIRNGTGAWGCDFTYQDQPFGFDINSATNTNSAVVTITALNAANATTRNYDTTDANSNSFWKLGINNGIDTNSNLNNASNHGYSHLAPPTAGGTLSVGGTLAVSVVGTNNNGDGTRTYGITGETFSYARPNTPSVSNVPFNANLQMKIFQTALVDPDTYLDPTNSSNNDQACYRSGCPSGGTSTAICANACSNYLSNAITNSGTNPVEIRYGRLRLNSVSGPADMNLIVPAVAEYWDGTIFTTNTKDNCTTILAGSTYTQLGNYTGNLSSGETSASSGGNPLIGGTANTTSNAISLIAPGANNYGSVDVTPTATGIPLWLFFDWDNNAATAFTAPTATASFGTYRGSDRIIYWQETQ